MTVPASEQTVRRSVWLLAVVTVVGLVASLVAGGLVRGAGAQTRQQRLNVAVARVIADIQSSVEAVGSVGTAVAVSATAGPAGAPEELASQVTLDRVALRLTGGRELGAAAPGLTSILILAARADEATPERVVAGSPARALQEAQQVDLTTPELQRVLSASAGSGAPQLSAPLEQPINGGQLVLVVPLYRTPTALQPTAGSALRLAETLGWVVVTVDGQTLIERAGRDSGVPANIEITDVSDPTPQLLADDGGPARAGPARVVILGVPARTWQIRITTAAGLLTATERALPWVIVLVGLLITGAAAVFTGLLVSQRSRALGEVARATSELAAVNHELRRSNADLAQFGAVAAHDLKSPLTVIRGMVHVIQRRLPQPVEAQLQEMLDAITRSVVKMSALIDDLLGYASAGAAAVQPEPLDLSELAQEVLDNIPAYRERPERVTVGELPRMRADRRLIGQALANLLGNAMKFVPEGVEPQVRLSATVRAGDVHLRVDDNGVGIPPEERDVVLQAFQRSSTSSEVEGTGLGLAIVSRVAFAHGGEIVLEDSPLGGLAVILRLPIDGPQVQPPAEGT